MTCIVPFPAGGTTDLLARIFAQKLSEAFGQSVVVENAGGGGGSIGADKVAKAAPDGYTLLLHNVTFSTTTTSLMATGRAKHTFDDFTPVSLAANVPLVVMCHPSVPAKDLKEFVTFAKEQNKADKGVFYGTTGPGSVIHLVAEVLKRDAGIKMDHVPFRGAAPLVQELLSGRIHLGGDQISTSLGHMRGGALRGLATLSPARTVAHARPADRARAGLSEHGAVRLERLLRAGQDAARGRRDHPGRDGQGRARSGREAPPRRGRRRGDGLDAGRTRQGAARSGRRREAAGRGAEAGGAVSAESSLPHEGQIMKSMSTKASLALAALCAVAAVVWTVQSHAALPPQYDRWHEFAAVLGDSSIPNKLRDLTDRIERVGEGSYRVYGGQVLRACLAVEARSRPARRASRVVGGSIISIAEVGELRCE